MTPVSIHDLFNPTLQAVRDSGGSATIQEIHDKVVARLEFSDEAIETSTANSQISHDNIWRHLSYVRTWLKHYGLLDNSSRGVWTLTPRGQSTDLVDPKEVDKVVKEKLRQEKASGPNAVVEAWRVELLDLLRKMDPSSFERLCMLMLRESGFSRVEVYGGPGDGGLDGSGILQVNDFLSFRVVFQCKRVTGSVGPGVVRDFRGAMAGRTDKGLIVTTGHFTRMAVDEATREGASEIQLVDGEQLIEKLRELSLGVSEHAEEEVSIDPDFFANI